MIQAFYTLTNSEIELLLRAPLLTSILIAGADGNIDHKEMKQAIVQAQKTESRAQTNMKEFYKMASQDFEDKLKILIAGYPRDPESRNKLIVNELESLNAIFDKLPRTFATELYNSLCSLAQSVATSSGGVFGMNKVGEEEARWVKLPMLRPPQT